MGILQKWITQHPYAFVGRFRLNLVIFKPFICSFCEQYRYSIKE